LEENLRVIEAHPRLGIHYMIDRNGTLRSSVPEDQVAHHVFRHSYGAIAVELINDGDGVDPYPEAQLASLVLLLRRLARKYDLAPPSIRRHSDLDHATMPCARTQPRKVDPGSAFPFERVIKRVYGEPPADR
jgi:N-acetyl-anhydromuramyl-L-alanine amidase AmpD